MISDVEQPNFLLVKRRKTLKLSSGLLVLAETQCDVQEGDLYLRVEMIVQSYMGRWLFSDDTDHAICRNSPTPGVDSEEMHYFEWEGY